MQNVACTSGVIHSIRTVGGGAGGLPPLHDTKLTGCVSFVAGVVTGAHSLAARSVASLQ